MPAEICTAPNEMNCTPGLFRKQHNFAGIHKRQAMNIITKFTVNTEKGMAILLKLTKELAAEKYSSLLDKKIFNNYIDKNFNEKTLIDEVNSLNNQWLVVYTDDIPAGYARITSKGKRPQPLVGKKAIRIADFGVLNPDPAVKESLFQKCLTVCRSYENVWINEYVNNPLISFFESKGFVRHQGTQQLDELPLPSAYFIS